MKNSNCQISIAARKREVITQLTEIVDRSDFLTPIIAFDVEGIWSVDRSFYSHSWGVAIDKSNPDEIAEAVEILGLALSFSDWIDSEVDKG